MTFCTAAVDQRICGAPAADGAAPPRCASHAEPGRTELAAGIAEMGARAAGRGDAFVALFCEWGALGAQCFPPAMLRMAERYAAIGAALEEREDDEDQAKAAALDVLAEALTRAAEAPLGGVGAVAADMIVVFAELPAADADDEAGDGAAAAPGRRA